MTSWDSQLTAQLEDQSPALYRLAYGFLRDGHAAEDVCQEAFTKAWQHRGRLRRRTALGGWLVRVVTNECLQVLRRRKVATKATVRQGLELTQPLGPDAQVELKDAVTRALGELPERTRLVVVLRLMQGRSGNEVKQMLGCSASQVSRRLHEGMEYLRAVLKEP